MTCRKIFSVPYFFDFSTSSVSNIMYLSVQTMVYCKFYYSASLFCPRVKKCWWHFTVVQHGILTIEDFAYRIYRVVCTLPMRLWLIHDTGKQLLTLINNLYSRLNFKSNYYVRFPCIFGFLIWEAHCLSACWFNALF